MTTRLIVGPFNRVEGDLEVRLEVEAGRVRQAFVTAVLFRDFEHLMRGRHALDALVIAPRICGICSVSQSSAALSALADAAGLVMPRNGRLVVNLLQGLENAADHLVHFALFFMPDFAREVYAGRPWHAKAVARFKAQTGELPCEASRARQRLFSAMGILAGKWPHSLAMQPGGTTKPVDAAERALLQEIVGEFRRFLEARIFNAPLERVAEAVSLEQLRVLSGGDLSFFLSIADDLDLWRLGRSPASLMCVGAYREGGEGGGDLFAKGLWKNGRSEELALDAIAEDVSCAWLAGGAPLHPAVGRTDPEAGKEGAYSWSKAPRLDGAPVEVGALARQVISGQELVRRLYESAGSTVGSRVTARLIELARLVPAMEGWVRAIKPQEPFCLPFPEPAQARGVGLVEAARGSLGHWLSIEQGRLGHYQVVSPTTWNFSPRDGKGVPGPLEAALEGLEIPPGQASPVVVQHVVRSFDPCMACTVH